MAVPGALIFLFGKPIEHKPARRTTTGKAKPTRKNKAKPRNKKTASKKRKAAKAKPNPRSEAKQAETPRREAQNYSVDELERLDNYFNDRRI
jgi:hypothetical protein